MKSFIIGTNGDQPFEINGACVSSEHAEITIDDNNIWTLKDLGSTNGTYVRDERTGLLTHISSVTIHPMSFICLGPDNSKGCSFYARQILNPEDFNAELIYMNDKEDEFENQQAQIEHTGRILNIIKSVLPVALICISFIVYPDGSNIQIPIMLIRVAGASIPAVLIQMFYDTTKKKKALNSMYERFRHCPNPECSRIMKSNEIRKMACMKCHCQK